MPPAYEKGTVKLGTWVKDLRKAHKKGKVNAERISQLEELGFEWVK